MSKYRELRRETAEKMGDDEHPPLPCMTCREDTPRATLSTYGARCVRCYQEYCRAAQSARPGTPRPRSILGAFGRVAQQDEDDAARRRDRQERQAQAVEDYAQQHGLPLSTSGERL